MQSHLTQQRRDATPSFPGQPSPNRPRQIAHGGIQANAPTQKALAPRFSVIRRKLSIYQRHRQWYIERMFCRLKDFRRIATRYDRIAANSFAAVYLAALVSYWL